MKVKNRMPVRASYLSRLRMGQKKKLRTNEIRYFSKRLVSSARESGKSTEKGDQMAEQLGLRYQRRGLQYARG